MTYDLIERKCVSCLKPFKVLSTSKSYHCSAYCRTDTIDNRHWIQLRNVQVKNNEITRKQKNAIKTKTPSKN